MAAFTWFIFALSWKIITAQNCDVTVGESCYFARIDGQTPFSYDEAVAYCQSQNAKIATIKMEDIYTQITEKLRTKIEDGENFARAWIGTKLDSSGNLSPEGSYAKWFPDFPDATHYGGVDYVNIYLAINEDPDYIDQGMVNSNADRKIPGVICKKAGVAPQEALIRCESVNGVSSNWLETVDAPGMTQFEAQKLCQDKGGIMAYPTSQEELECYDKLQRPSNKIRSWIGIFRENGSPDYKQMAGPAPPYVEKWITLPGFIEQPGEKGVYVAYSDRYPPYMVVTDRTSKRPKSVICSLLD